MLTENPAEKENALIEKAKENEVTLHRKAVASFRELLIAEFSYQTGGGLEVIPFFDEILEDERRIEKEQILKKIEPEIIDLLEWLPILREEFAAHLQQANTTCTQLDAIDQWIAGLKRNVLDVLQESSEVQKS